MKGASILALFQLASGHEMYKTRIPNADGIAGVSALGHLDVNGRGPRNAFGQEFAANGYQWTLDLCRSDSDQDGKTNGEELGDPCCKFTPSNGATLIADGLSHPGLATQTTRTIDNSTCSSFGVSDTNSAETLHLHILLPILSLHFLLS